MIKHLFNTIPKIDNYERTKRKKIYLYCKRFCLENCPSFDCTGETNNKLIRIKTNFISQNMFET